MQGEKKTSLGSSHWIAIAVIVMAFLTHSLCAQSSQGRQECERLFSAAVAAEQQNNHVLAEAYYEQCQELAKQHRVPQREASALHRLAVLRARSKKFTESADLFRRAAALDPKNAIILCDFAQLYVDRKDYDEAEKLLKQALLLEPNNQRVLVSLGVLIASQRNERQAEGLHYLKLAVGEAEAYRELAKIYRSRGDVGRAEFAEQQALHAGNQPTTSPTFAAEDISIPPPQTPSVNRVRQEVTDIQRQTTPAPRQPFIPTPRGTASPEKIKVIPTENTTGTTAASVHGTPTSAADPFVTIHPQESPAATAPATTADRFGPLLIIQPSERSKMLDTITFVQATDTKTSTAHSPEPSLIKITSPSKAGSPKPEGGTAGAGEIPQPFPVSEELNEQMNVPRVLPNGEKQVGQSGNPLRQFPPGRGGLIDPSAETSTIAVLPSFSAVPSFSAAGVKKFPSTDVQNERGHSQNPTVSVHPAVSVRDDTARDDTAPVIALAQPKSVSMLLVPAQTPVKVEAAKTIPATDVNVLQSSSAVIARRDLPVSPSRPGTPPPATEKKSYTLTSISSDTSRSVSSKPESKTEQKPASARMIPSGQRFASTSAPAVLQFGTVRNDSSPEVSAREQIASKPSEMHMQPQVADVPPVTDVNVRPLLVVKGKSEETPPNVPAIPLPTATNGQPGLLNIAEGRANEPPVTEPPVTELLSPFPALVAMAPTDPLSGQDTPVGDTTVVYNPFEKSPQFVEPQPSLPALVAVAPAESFLTVTDDPSEKTSFVEVQKIEPQTPSLVAAAPPKPLPVVADDSLDKPRFIEVEKIEPQTPLPVMVAVVPPDPFLPTNEQSVLPKFADVPKIEPQTSPSVAAATPPDPFLAVNNNSAPPQFAAIQRIEPQLPPPPVAAAPPNLSFAIVEKAVPPAFAEMKKPTAEVATPSIAAPPADKPRAIFAQNTPQNTPHATSTLNPSPLATPLPSIAAPPTAAPKAVIAQNIPKETPRDTPSHNPSPPLAEVATPLPRIVASPTETPTVAQNIPSEPLLRIPSPPFGEVATSEPPPQLVGRQALPTPQSVPLREALSRPLQTSAEPTGFASSRSTTQRQAPRIELSEEQPMGFARSRK